MAAEVAEKPIESRLENDVKVASVDYTRYGSDEETVEAYKTVLAWPAEERRRHERTLVRRLDMLVLLPVVVMYVTNYLDRTSISQARVTGLLVTTHTTSGQFSLVNGIFYISYIVGQTPANMILSRVRPSVFMPTVMILWAVVSTCTAATKSFGQLLAVRFILGFTEAPFFPGAAFYLTCWYTRAEIGRRYAIYISGICLSSMIGGLISAGIVNGMNGKRGLEGWQWIFIIEGSITVVIALCVLFIIPDYPHTSRHKFSAIDRVLAQLRLDEDTGTHEASDVPVRQGALMAVKDYRTWVMGTLQLCITNMIGFNFFYPVIVQGMGYTNNITVLLLSAPPYAVAALCAFGLSWSADRWRARAVHWEIALAVTALGLILLIALANVNSPGARYFSTYILASGSFSAYSVAYPWIAALIPRPLTKRATAIAIANSLSNLGAFISSYVFYAPSFGPTYQKSWGIVLALTGYSACAIAFLSWRNRKTNKQLDVIEEQYRQGAITEEQLTSMGTIEVLAAKTGFRLAN